MTNEVVVAILALIGTLIGSFSAGKLVTYRIDQLEKKVEKHNGLADRVLELEINMRAQWEKVDDARKAIEELKREAA